MCAPVYSHRDLVDAAAEREAAAVEWLTEQLDEPVGLTRLQRARRDADEARERGLPPVRPQRYARRRAVRAWLKILAALQAGRIPAAPRIDLFSTAEDRRRYARRRLERQRLLVSLAPLRGGRRLTLGEARALLGMSEDGFAKVLYRGDVPRIHDAGGVRVRLGDVRNFLTKKLFKPRRVARACA